MSNNKELGDKGEKIAVKYLMHRGWEIMETNYRYSRYEIDIIGKRGDLLIFVEVKLRTDDTYGYPEDFVDKRKAEMIIAAADEYIYQINWNKNIRFDIMSILLKGNNDYSITYFKDAFY